MSEKNTLNVIDGTLRSVEEKFKKFIQESSLPVLEVDVSDNDILRITQQIANWLNETGGLWANY